MGDQVGEFLFPGVDAILSASATHVTGSRPTLFEISTTPMHAPTKQIGDLRIQDSSNPITFKGCAVIEGSYRFNRSGQIIGMLLEDRRWKWKFTVVDGHYNVKGGDGEIIESTRKSLKELFEILLKEMKETKFDLSEVKSEKFPEIKWVAANGAEELANLEAIASCRVVLHLNDRIKLHPIGKGKRLPDDHVIEGGTTVEAKAIPSSVLFVGGRTAYQLPVPLIAAGLDTDKKVKRINDLSYTPKLANGQRSWGKNYTPGSRENIVDPSIEETEKGRKIVDLAVRTVFRWYQIDIPKKGIKFPGRKEIVRTPREFLDILSTLVGAAELFEDLGRKRKLKSDIPARVVGNFYDENPFRENAIVPTRADQHDFNRHAIYDGSFRINADSLRVEFSEPIYRQSASGEVFPAVLWLFTTFNLQTIEGKEDRLRVERKVPGSKKNDTGPHVVMDESVVLSNDAQYDESFDDRQKLLLLRPKSKYVTNKSVAEKEANLIIDAEMRKFELTPGEDKLYAGFQKIELDGAILQVQWSRAEDGRCTTRVSRNSEFPTPLPTESERKKIMKQQRAIREFDRRQGRDRRDRFSESKNQRVD